jgi:hypothetical protein
VSRSTDYSGRLPRAAGPFSAGSVRRSATLESPMERSRPAGAEAVSVRPATIMVLIGLAVGCAALAVTLVLIGRAAPAGALTGAGGGLVILAGVRAREAGSARLAFADATIERAIDAGILAAVAWAALPSRPLLSAAALVAMGSSYLAAYLRAKATGVGFPLEDSLIVRALRWGILALGLTFPFLLPFALWAAAAVSVQLVLRHSFAVARRPG